MNRLNTFTQTREFPIDDFEIRIGNYVLDRGGKILKVDYWERPGMVAQNIVVDGNTMHPLTEMVSECNPIPLTEEWLIKFGAFYQEKESEFECDINEYLGFAVSFKMDKFKFYLDTESGALELEHIKHVNQLQNLYFALTGKELTT